MLDCRPRACSPSASPTPPPQKKEPLLAMNCLPRCLLPRTSLLLMALLAVPAAGLTSCSKDDAGGGSSNVPAFQAAERKTQSASDDLGRLVPADATVFVHVNNLGEMEGKVKDLVKSFQPGMEGMVDLAPMYAQVGLRAKDFDQSKPAGVALTEGPMGMPAPVLILPAKNAKEVADISELPLVVSGNYVGASPTGRWTRWTHRPSPRPAFNRGAKELTAVPQQRSILRVETRGRITHLCY